MLSFDPLRRAVREGLALKRVTLKELDRPARSHLDETIAEGYVPPAPSSRTPSTTCIVAHFQPPTSAS